MSLQAVRIIKALPFACELAGHLICWMTFYRNLP